MSDQKQQTQADRFVLVEDAARSLNIEPKVIRQGIACGIVPMRTDNLGIVRIHLGEIPKDLQDRINMDDVQPELHRAVLMDEVAGLEQSLAETHLQRTRLEELVVKQGAAITRYAQLIDKQPGHANEADVAPSTEVASDTLAETSRNLAQRESEVEKLSQLLERTFQAIDARDRQLAAETDQLSQTTGKAITLLERAVREGELSTSKLQALNQQVSSTAESSVRLENELDERNAVINNQNTLMERLVALAEQSVTNASNQKPRKRTVWQRLFGGGKGI